MLVGIFVRRAERFGRSASYLHFHSAELHIHLNQSLDDSRSRVVVYHEQVANIRKPEFALLGSKALYYPYRAVHRGRY